MSTPSIRAALEQLIVLDSTSVTLRSKQSSLVWSDAIAAARAALAQPEGQGQGERTISIAKAVQEHAFGWEPDARLIGNVCAEDVADLCSAILTRWGRPTAPAALPAPQVGGGRWSEGICGDGAAILCDGAMVPIEEVVRALNRIPAAPPAPGVGEVGLLVDRLNQGAIALDSLCNKIVNGECRTGWCLHRGGWIRGAVDPSVATCPELEKAAAMRRAAALLQQLSAPAPAVVPVAVEALTRLYWWGGMSGSYGYSADVFLGVRDWISGGMAGDLPPLPAWIADRCPSLPQAGEVEA